MSRLRSAVLSVTLAVTCLLAGSAWATTITVNATAPGLRIPREIYGNNALWFNFNSYYDNGGTLPSNLLADIRNLGVGSLRYPGGGGGDSFWWEDTVGPLSSRPTLWIGGPAYPFAVASFGLDEFMRLCEQTGAEPQLTFIFRNPDAATKYQAESTTVYAIANNASGGISIQDTSLDNQSSLVLPGVGDSVTLKFTVYRDGYYQLNLRNRAGTSQDRSSYWSSNAYSYLLTDATGSTSTIPAVTFTGDSSTLSAADSYDGSTVWGTTRSNIIFLHKTYQPFYLTVTNSGGGNLRLDYLDVMPRIEDNAVKRAEALVAYCNGDASDTRVIGVDQAGVDWHSIGYWANQRAINGHPEPYSVKYWEVGNEAWGGDPYGSPAGQNISAYYNGWQNYYDAISPIDPYLRLSLCGYKPDTNWTNKEIQAKGDVANFIHFHPYEPGDPNGTDPMSLYLEGVTSATGVQNFISGIENAISTYQPARVGKIMGSASEYSAAYGWGWTYAMDFAVRMSGVLTVADQLGTFTKNTDFLQSAQYWLLYGRPGSQNVCTFEGVDSSYYKNAIYDALQLYGSYFGDQVLPVTVSPDCPTYSFAGWNSLMPAGDYPMLSTYASQDSSNYYLIVINKDPMNAQQATLAWTGLPDATNVVQTRTIAANAPLPNYTAINTATSQVIVTTTGHVAPYARQLEYTFPACSVTGFILPKAPLSNLVSYREAEDIFTINTDVPPYGTVTVASSSYDSGYPSRAHVVMGNLGDTIVIPFSVRERQAYTISLRTRSGQPGSPTSFWDNAAYSYFVDGRPVTFVGDTASISPLDSGSIYWGVASVKDQMLDMGRHYLKITSNRADCMVDWIQVAEERCSSSEAESAYTVVTNSSSQISVADLGLDSGHHLCIGSGDVVDLDVSAPRSGLYDVLIRVRSGDAAASSDLLPYYVWKVNGDPVNASLDSNSVSVLDNDGATYWGTVEIPCRYLAAGSNRVRISYSGSVLGRIDYVAVTAVSGSAIAILNPKNAGTFVTDSSALALAGVATDDIQSVTWSNSGGGTGSATGASSWTAQIPLGIGDNKVTVNGYNQDGLAATASIDVVRVQDGTTLSQVKALLNNASVQLASKSVTAVFSDRFYIEEADRSEGIMVKPTIMPLGIAVGFVVCIDGSITSDPTTGERYISGTATVKS